MTQPLVTVGITAYNAEDTIEMAIVSALAQTWQPLEIVVVDDCSTDATAEKAAAAAKGHRNVRVVRCPTNGGVAAARNVVLREAAGEFVVFFDDDDESLPQRIAAQVGRIVAYETRLSAPAPVICHAARRQIYPNGSRRIETTMGTKGGFPAPHGRAVAERILNGTPVADGFGSCATCSQMARRATYLAVGGFDPEFRRSEDTDLCVRLALAGAHFVGIAEPLVTQKMTLAADKTLVQDRDYALALLRKHRASFRNRQAADFALSWTRLKFVWLAGRRADFLAGLIGLWLRHPVAVTKRILYALPTQSTRSAFRSLHR